LQFDEPQPPFGANLPFTGVKEMHENVLIFAPVDG